MEHPDDTRALTRAIASGDPDSFTRLYDAWFAWVLAEVRRFTGRDEDFALDITQDVMLTAARKMRTLDSRGALGAWLRTTALRHALTRLRSEKRRVARERGRGEQTGAGKTPVADEHRRWIRAALETLDDDARSLIEARFRLGHTLRTIGAAAGISPSAADGRINRTVDRLRSRAQQEGLTHDD